MFDRKLLLVLGVESFDRGIDQGLILGKAGKLTTALQVAAD